jgi:hypothetical protein
MSNILTAQTLGQAMLKHIDDGRTSKVSEQNLTTYLRKGLKPFGHLQRHEDGSSSGIPDISYGIRGTSGWIEAKYKREWPKGELTTVKFNHFTSEQRLWLRLRGRESGRCWVVVQVEREWFLFDWRWAVGRLGKAPRVEMLREAVAHWSGHVDWGRLAHLLTCQINALEPKGGPPRR